MSKWQTKQIKELGRVITGKTPPTSENKYFDGEHLFVSPKDLDWDKTYVTKTETRISKQALDKFKNQVISTNSVMYTSLSFAFGKVGIASEPSLTNQQINSIIVYDEHDFRFVYYLLRASRPIIFSFNSGIDTPIVPKSIFEQIELKCPPLSVQKKIAAVLSAYDDLIENNDRRITLLEKMAEEIYREWFVRLRFPGHKHLTFHKGIPEGWEIARVRNFGRVITGKTPSTQNAGYYGGSFPFIKTPDMHGNMFVLQTEETLSQAGLDSQKKQTLSQDSICVNCIGALSGSVSITAQICQTNQQINCLILDNLEYREFLFFSLKNLKESIHLFGNTGSTMTNLSKGKFENLQILKPYEKTIYLYHNSTKQMFKSIKILGKRNILLKQTRDRLLTRLISGKLPVEDLDIQFPPSMTDLQ